MPAAASRPRPAARALSAALARAKLLAKLETAGVKGVVSFYTAKTTADDRSIYDAEIAALEASQELFVDRRKPKPKYFTWSARPQLPSAASVAGELAATAARSFPLLLSEADLKKSLGKQPDKAAVLPAAIALLLEQKRFVALAHRSGKKETRLFVATEPLGALLQTGAAKALDFRAAHVAAAARTGFPAVMISALLRESGADLQTTHDWLRAEYRAGRAVLSVGDWSLAHEDERAAVLELNGERYLQVRLLT